VKELSEIDRLDLAARAVATKAAISRARLPLTLVSLFFVLLAIISEAAFYETVAVRVLAMLAVATTVMLWRNSRYAVYALAILFFFFAVLYGGWLFDDPDSHTLLGSTTGTVVSAVFLFIGYRWWSTATPFIAAQSEGLKRERSQMGEWIRVLKSSEGTDDVVEFSIRSFLRGYWTYRLLNTKSCWVIARFKTGNMARLLGCRVLGLDAVHVTNQPGGKLHVEMGDRSIQDVEISADMRDRLLHFVAAG
jgi:hypothetical protein